MIEMNGMHLIELKESIFYSLACEKIEFLSRDEMEHRVSMRYSRFEPQRTITESIQLNSLLTFISNRVLLFPQEMINSLAFNGSIQV